MNEKHEVGRTSYETYCACTGTAKTATSWQMLGMQIKEVWRKVEVAGLRASATALALSSDQRHQADQQRIHDLEQALVGSITG